MSTALVISGAVFELAGLGLVFAEVAIIGYRDISEVFEAVGGAINESTPRAVLRLSRERVREAGRLEDTRTNVRPDDTPLDATDGQRIERLERYVKNVDCDVDDLWQTLSERACKVLEEAARREDELLRAIEERESRDSKVLGPSLLRQVIGAICLFVGIVLGTLGNVL
jgi:hypothetical protein